MELDDEQPDHLATPGRILTVEDITASRVQERVRTRGEVLGRGFRFARRQVKTHATLLKFALVGSLGYLIYGGLLFLLYDNHALAFLPERGASVDLLLFTYDDALLLTTTLIGTEASIVAVFAGHSLWTFVDRPKDKPLWLRFVEYQLKALVPTLGILTLVVNGLVVGFGLHHYIAVPAGFAASFSWNWVIDNWIIWRSASTIVESPR